MPLLCAQTMAGILGVEADAIFPSRLRRTEQIGVRRPGRRGLSLMRLLLIFEENKDLRKTEVHLIFAPNGAKNQRSRSSTSPPNALPEICHGRIGRGMDPPGAISRRRWYYDPWNGSWCRPGPSLIRTNPMAMKPRVRPRSGLAIKHGITCPETRPVRSTPINRGELKVIPH